MNDDMIILNDNVAGVVIDIGTNKAVGCPTYDDEKQNTDGTRMGALLFDIVSDKNTTTWELGEVLPLSKPFGTNPEDHDVCIKIHSLEGLNLLRKDLDIIEKYMTREED